MRHVMPRWTAEITNDPQKDYALVIDLLEDDEMKARIERGDDKALVLRVFCEGELRIPASWLSDLLDRAVREPLG